MSDLIPAWTGSALTPVDKMEVHRRGLRHKAVSVFVMAGERTLLQRRAAGKYHTPGLWANACCTHPLWNEAPEACAERRLRQELGIEGLAPRFRHRVEYRADVGNGLTEHEVVDIFTAEAGAGLGLDPDPGEVSETRWIGLGDLLSEVDRAPERFVPWLRIYLSDHAERIFGALVRA